MKPERILMTDFRNNAKKYVEEMYRGKNFYIGKSEKTIGCTDSISVQKCCQTKEKVSDKKEVFEELKSIPNVEVVAIQKMPSLDEVHSIIQDKKLRGEHPLDLNEFIDDITTSSKYSKSK